MGKRRGRRGAGFVGMQGAWADWGRERRAQQAALRPFPHPQPLQPQSGQRAAGTTLPSLGCLYYS